MQAPRSSPEPGAGASATTGLRQDVEMPLPPARMQAPVPTAAQTSVTNAKILLSGNANGEVNAYPPLARPLPRCDSLNSLLAKRKQAAASIVHDGPIAASSNMIAMLEAEDKQAGTPKKVRVTGSQTESDDDMTEPQDLEAGPVSFGGQYAAFNVTPSLQLSGKVGVGTQADMIQDKEMIIEKLPPRNLGRLAGEDITARIDDNNRAFFDGKETVRKGYLHAGGVAYVPAYDAYRMSGASNGTSDRESKPDALVAAEICTYHDIVWAKSSSNVSAAPKICMDQNLYCHM